MEQVFIYAFIFVATMLLVDTLLRFIFRARRAEGDINSRLRHLRQTDNQQAAFDRLLTRRGFGKGSNATFVGKVRRFYGQSGIEMTLPRAIAIMVLLFTGFGIVFFVIITRSPVWLPVLSLVATLLSVVGFVVLKRRSRIRRFQAQLPNAIDIIVRSLQAGHPLNAAVSLVSREMSDPIGSEFGMLNDQIAFGYDLESGMINMYDRVGAEELKLLTVTVTVQSGTGGNLAEILENLSTMIRDRAMMRAKIRAISSEGRMTAWVMALFPFGLFLMIKAMVPDYFDPLIETGNAPAVVAVCLGMMAVGIVVLYRMVNFDF